ncbi:hypothetical protein [Sphingomonas sp. GC_Shp_3]|jgi:hypothetical protein|uniref:hypothetical protein n=1 Tax=Sphingomonas sp. GC_Shp_3 TaxID=2937383 RepID=UPI00226AB653|nr:hypothetical protein [Sphingomonas sp. GC_Shp_3]
MLNLLRRAGALALACILLASPTAPALAQSRIVTPNASVIGLPGPFPFDGSEWMNFRQSREAVTAPITTVLAQVGVRQTPTTVTASTLAIPNDPSQFFLMNSTSAQVVTIPSGLTRWAVGNTITIVQLGTGAVSIAAGSGATIYKRSTTFNSAGVNSIITLVNVGPDTWIAAGGLN